MPLSMILNAVIFAFHLLLLVLPMWLYRSGRPFMAKFGLWVKLRGGICRHPFAYGRSERFKTLKRKNEL